ncbi:MAG: hypothetical protein ACRDYD_09960 [Acidimicrobiales bacterium]
MSVRVRLAALRRRREEGGQAMILVVGVILLLTLLPLVVFNQAIQQLPIAHHDQSYQAALGAAEAGVDDYLNRLNEDGNYWIYSASNPPPTANGAFTGWVPIAGTGESFRYTPDTSATLAQGIVYLDSSGKAGNVVRTVRVGMRRQGFLDYLYFTDYETADPASYQDPATAKAYCQYHAYDPNPQTGGYGPDPNWWWDSNLGQWQGCNFIYFADKDVLNGPVHTNDALYICGSPTFKGDVDSSDPTAPRWIDDPSCGGSPSFSRSGDPAYQGVLSIPPSDQSVKAEAAVGTSQGCLYTGPTTIVLKGASMSVTSPDTRSTNPGCVGANVALPADGVIYVQNIPSSRSDPNYSSNPPPNPVGDLARTSGDAEVSGTLAGQLTIAADDDVVAMGNLQYSGGLSGNDVLGLIANNNVLVYHPTWPTRPSCSSLPSMCNLTIDAAILSVQHSFTVDNYADGSPMGTLTINGAIAQRFRGPVGTFSGNSVVSGYVKSYNYDARLKYLTPPYFLDPVQSAWQRVSFAELKPAY